jgi:hypothetical protein
MVNTRMFEFKHPKYYTELRKRNKSDQAISLKAHDGECERAPDPGLKLPGPRPISNANKGLIHRQQASSGKHQATSAKLQAPSSDKKL